MARPNWITISQNIAVLPEGEFFNYSIEATNAVKFQLIAGELPLGIQVVELASNGKSSIQGTPIVTTVNETESTYNYNFAIRATSADGLVADRSFSLTVTSIKLPVIVAPATDLGILTEGQYYEKQITAVDFTPADQLKFSIASGSLPVGLTLSESGLISGYVRRLDPSVLTPYTFIIEVTDGVNRGSKFYSLVVDLNPEANLPPVILTKSGSLGEINGDNFFSTLFTGLDFDNDPIEFFIANPLNGLVNIGEQGFDTFEFDMINFDQTISNITQILTLDSATGWLHGRLPIVNSPITFKFMIGCRKTVAPFTSSLLEDFEITINPPDYKIIEWKSPEDLGFLYNGMISDIALEATSPSGSQLYYRLLPYDPLNPDPIRLPQGLFLTESGLLVGRTSFRYFSLDNNETTVTDKNITTYDETYTFTVEVLNNPNPLLANERNTRTFTIRVLNRNPIPYENIYIQALPTVEKRTLFENLVNSTNWIPESAIYRAEDPNFGRAKDLRMLFLPGIEAPLLESYIDAETLNHYRKDIKLDKIKYARATDSNFNVLYEVIYATIVDPLENENGESVAKEIDLVGKLLKYYKVNNVNQTKIYPNSLKNMRDRFTDLLELENRGVLPRWMTSVQEDGSVLGPIEVVPIAYVKPGAASVAIQKLNDQILNSVNIKNLSAFSFEIDRYNIDRHLSKYWNVRTGAFLSSSETTFDRFANPEALLQLAGTVDVALNVPFDTINNATIEALLGYSNPTVVSGEVFPVTHPSWTSWMNENAVWVNPRTNALPSTSHVIERDFYVGTSDIHEIIIMNTDNIRVEIDGYLVREIIGSNVVTDINDSYSTLFLATGTHTIKIYFSTGSGNVIWNLNPTGFGVAIKYGSDIPFSTRKNNEAKLKYNAITGRPGLDGIAPFEGMKLIFAKQDNYPNYDGENNGWNITDDPYGAVFDSTIGAYNKFSVVPGLYEKTLNNSIANQRAGIWTVNIESGIVKLTFAQEVRKNQTVRVLNGETYGGSVLILANDPFPQGSSELNYFSIPKTFTKIGTRFDGDSTRFIDYRDLYVDPGRGDKYVIYPKLGVFE